MHAFAIASLLTVSAPGLACQSAHAATAGGAPPAPSAGLLPPARQAIEVRVGDAAQNHLEQLVLGLADATGVVFAMSEPARATLRATRTGLFTDLTIPQAEAWPWAEALLLHHGYVLSVQTSRPPYVIGILMVGRQSDSPPNYLRVQAADIGLLAEHPALLVQTVIDIPHVDVRQLGNSLRALTADPSGAQNVTPIGNSNSAILTGTGRSVLDLVEMLREIEETARKTYEKQTADGSKPPPPPPPQPTPQPTPR